MVFGSHISRIDIYYLMVLSPVYICYIACIFECVCFDFMYSRTIALFEPMVLLIKPTLNKFIYLLNFTLLKRLVAFTNVDKR